ncbi:MAG: YicC/YloC family endoribonuclease, partial [Desulfobacterales bacterium]
MTAYASAEKTADDLKATIEIRSYNSRHIDMFIRIPSPYQSVEDKLKQLISSRIARGRLEIRLQIEDRSSEAAALEIDEARANAIMAIFEQLSTKYKLKDDITLNMLLNAGGIIKPIEKSPN